MRKSKTNEKKYPPSTTPEGRENQVIAMAYDLAEQQIRNGTATSQVISHFLKLGSKKERLEREILEEQKKLIISKRESIESQQSERELMEEALNAFRNYSGNGGSDDSNIY